MKTNPPEHKRSLVFYVIALLIFGAGIVFILKSGSQFRPDKPRTEINGDYKGTPSSNVANVIGPKPTGLAHLLLDHAKGPLSTLLIQIIIIVLAAKLVGGLFKRKGQPSVIGEMIAGKVRAAGSCVLPAVAEEHHLAAVLGGAAKDRPADDL